MSTNTADDDFTLYDLIRVAHEDWKILVGAVVVTSVLAVVYALMVTPVFRASAVVLEIEPASQSMPGAQGLLGQVGGLIGAAGISLDGLRGTQDRGRILLQSRSFVEEFIERNELMPVILEADLDHEPSLWEAAQEFRRSVYSVDYDRDSGLTTISVEWTDPVVARDWANGLVALANEIARNRDIAEAERSIAYLNARIAETNVVELRDVLYNLIESEQKTLMLANARADYVVHVVDPAVAPFKRARPHRRLIAILGFVAGLLIGPVLVALRRTARHYRAQA